MEPSPPKTPKQARTLYPMLPRFNRREEGVEDQIEDRKEGVSGKGGMMDGRVTRKEKGMEEGGMNKRKKVGRTEGTCCL